MFLTGKRSPFLGEMKNSVVNVFPGNFTTETQSITEFAQRNSFFRQTPLERRFRAVESVDRASN